MRVYPRKEQDSLQESTSLGDSGSGIGGEVGILLLLLPLLGGVGWVFPGPTDITDPSVFLIFAFFYDHYKIQFRMTMRLM